MVEWTISQVSERTAVPVATIKYYIREGLLPRPRTTGRTKGHYDEAFVNRLEVIRELRDRHRLSLREIGELLQEAGPTPQRMDLELRIRTRQHLTQAIDPLHAMPLVSHDQVQSRSGLTQEDIEELIRHGFLSPIPEGPGGEACYSEGDVRIAEVVGALRRSGYHEGHGFHVADLVRYADVLSGIVVREVESFDHPALRSLSGEEILRLITQGVAQIDVLLGLLHKKLLLRAVFERRSK